MEEIAVKRSDNDLDSVCTGSPSKAQIKLYLNTRTDSEDDIKRRLDLLLSGAKYASDKMGEGGKQ